MDVINYLVIGEMSLTSSPIFIFSPLSPPLKGVLPLIWANLKTLYLLSIPFAKFGWNWLSSSAEDENVKSLRRQRRPQTKLVRNQLDLIWMFVSGELNVFVFSMTLRHIMSLYVFQCVKRTTRIFHGQIDFDLQKFFIIWSKSWKRIAEICLINI